MEIKTNKQDLEKARKIMEQEVVEDTAFALIHCGTCGTGGTVVNCHEKLLVFNALSFP